MTSNSPPPPEDSWALSRVFSIWVPFWNTLALRFTALVYSVKMLNVDSAKASKLGFLPYKVQFTHSTDCCPMCVLLPAKYEFLENMTLLFLGGYSRGFGCKQSSLVGSCWQFRDCQVWHQEGTFPNQLNIS